MRTKLSRKNLVAALTLVEVLVIIAIFFIFAGLYFSSMNYHGSYKSMRIVCINNLKQIGTAFRMRANDSDDKFPMQLSVTNGGTMEFVNSPDVFMHFQVLSNQLQTPKVLICPADKDRRWATNFTTDFNNSKISYFLVLDADEATLKMFLSGDRNITNGFRPRNGILTLTTNQVIGWTHQLHNCNGNLLIADGHVDLFSNARLRQALQNTGVATNRLAIP